MRKPNFFIIGSPKCGTTSLARYLIEHPKIFFPARKELHFFNTDMRSRMLHSEGEYYAYFSGAGPEHAAVGEGSVSYLYSDAAVPNILKAIPDARFIVMLRNPIEMMASWHAHLRHYGLEDTRDIERAWHKQEARRNGRGIPSFCADPSLLLYGQVCSAGWQLKRLYGRVPRDRVLVLFQDDLRADARSVYQMTLDFLGVQDDGRVEFGVHNQHFKPIRSQLVQVVIHFVSQFKLRFGINRSFGVLPLLYKFNTQGVKNEVINARFRSELAEYFRPDLEQLSELVGRDLSLWLRV